MSIESQLTLKQLRAFVSVYRRGKLALAAEEIGVTLSAISVLIRQAEDALGVRLFDRTTRSLVPTQAADDAFGIAERILQDVGTLGSHFRGLSEGSRGRVRLAATPATAAALLPATVERFTRRYGAISLVIDDCAPNQFLTLIESERVDFGIGTLPPQGGEFEAVSLVDDQVVLVCSNKHALAGREAVRWRDLEGVPIIALRHGYGVRQMIDAILHRAGIQPVVAHEVGFAATGLWMAASGLGVTILPRALAHGGFGAALAARPLIEPAMRRTVGLVTRKGRSLSPAARLFIDMLDEDLQGRFPRSGEPASGG